MNILTDVVLRHAQGLAKEVNAKALVFDAALLHSAEHAETILEGFRDCETQLVLITPSKELPLLPKSEKLHVLNLPQVPLTRMAQIKIAVVMGVAEKIFERTDGIVWLSGAQNTGR